MKLRDKLKKAVKKKAWNTGKKAGKSYLKYKAVSYGWKKLRKKVKKN
ncbi:hypothetical protein GKQ38_00395 [Candidatus Nanohaloarchaea archaeon]|nr:hypothetical protein GKQ38_00395 [Candidatus Nanohaloarchaea archaeon]